jgi:2-oxo-4-hydroxy-4-carboxy-5-ureidoimidazoline decarboxylase
MVTGPGMPKVNGNMNTHVLNAVSGKPAEGMNVELYELMGDTRRKLNQQTLNVEGRCMLMDGRPVPIGRYEIRFGLADYFRKSGVTVGDPAYLDVVPVRISIASPEDPYHVPLICTPWSYSTYRGT